MRGKILLPILLLCLILLSSASVLAQNNGMVVKFENGLYIINKGRADGLTEGREIWLKRLNKPIAVLKVAKVADYYCGAEVVRLFSEEQVQIGDQLSLTPPTSTVAANSKSSVKEETKPEPKPRPTKPIKVKTPDQLAKEAAKEREKRQEQISKDYLSTLDRFSKSITFSNSKGTRMLPGLGNITNAYALVTALTAGTGGGMHNPFTILSFAKGAISDHQATRRAARLGGSVKLDIIYYSDELIRSQAKFFASKDGTEEDPNQVNAIADGIRNQISADLYTVFQVKLENTSQTALQIAPFKWKMSLLTENNEQIKALKYDDALDKTLGPGQTAQGFIYFPKTDAAGNKLDYRHTKVKLESILNKKAELKWE